MNIPDKIYRSIEELPFVERAIVLALVTEYMENGTINAEATGKPLEFFMGIKSELDKVLRRRIYAREYRARKKAESTRAKQSPFTPQKPKKEVVKNEESPKRIFKDSGNLTRRKRRKLEKKGFIII